MTTAALVAFQLILLTAALAALTRAIVVARQASRAPYPASSDLRLTSLGWACAATIIGTSATAVGAVIVIWL